MPCASTRPAGAESRAAGGSARAPPEGGNLDAGAGGVEAPPVVGALQHVRLAVPERQGGPPVRAAIGEGHDPPAGPVEHPGLAQEQHLARLLGHLGRPGHRMPATPQGGIDVRQQAHHGGPPWCATLAGVKKAGQLQSRPVILDRFRVTDQVAIVTGSGRGIGAAAAVALAEAGADIVLAARTEEQLRQVAAQVEAAGRGPWSWWAISPMST